jgi:hypothetical protein
VILAGAAFWLALATDFASYPGVMGIVEAALLLLVGFSIAVGWVIYSLAWPGVFRSWRRGLVWLAVLAVPGIAVIGFATKWPLTVRVWMNEQSLREYAETRDKDMDLSNHDGTIPANVGSFQVWEVRRRGSAVFLITTVWAVHGLVYAPEGIPAYEGGPYRDFRHLYGPWYSFVIPD